VVALMNAISSILSLLLLLFLFIFIFARLGMQVAYSVIPLQHPYFKDTVSRDFRPLVFFIRYVASHRVMILNTGVRYDSALC
jgi:hypothetical protein